ncbi:MAG: hypothetical protein IPH77_07700 [Ignavibacteria bacterium]|nr:hypothetical protein [Ignavibacteria bacterium]
MSEYITELTITATLPSNIIPLFETPVFLFFCIAAMSYADSLIKPAWNAVSSIITQVKEEVRFILRLKPY